MHFIQVSYSALLKTAVLLTVIIIIVIIVRASVNTPRSKKWTWRPPESRTGNQIDHFLCNDFRLVGNYQILNNFQFLSDHRICRVKPCLTLSFKGVKRYTPRK